jgi:hypothetical protein
MALYCFGFHLHARKTDFGPVSNRLDIGISVFFVVLVVKLIVEQKGMVMLFLPDLIEGALWGKAMLARSWPWIEHTATVIVRSKFVTRWVESFLSAFGVGSSGTFTLPTMISGDGKLNLFNLKMVSIAAAIYSLMSCGLSSNGCCTSLKRRKRDPDRGLCYGSWQDG